MSNMSTDTTTLATDLECAAIEAKARSSGVMHWPELVRVFNRMRAAERERDELRSQQPSPPDHHYKQAMALEAAEKEREQWYAAFVNAGKLGEAAEKRCAALEKALQHYADISGAYGQVARAALATAPAEERE